ncbi:hypothetical protein PTKIN_Ptkin05aG0184400 [Pterospermum kingtungense]
MDIWNKARSFAEEAAKRSSELTKEAARRSSDLTIGSAKLGDIVSEASKRSKEIAAEASKRADQIRVEAAKRADLIRSSLAEGIAPPPNTERQAEQEEELERFGINEELRDFVKGITLSTFQDFPFSDDSPMSDVATVSNIRQDLTEWQEKHANLVLLTVKESSNVEMTSNPQATENKQHSKSLISSTEQDLDEFLLGGDSDEALDDGDEGFDDDFDKMVDSSDDEKDKL